MTKRTFLTGIAIVLTALSACKDETLDIGKTLTADNDKLNVSRAEYDVPTRTVMADSVLLRSSYCYLGRVKDPETGDYVTSEFMTQFNVLESFTLPKEETVITRYNGMAAADSVAIQLYMEDATTITNTQAAMKIRVREMARPMEEDRRYYSNFDPVSEGYIRTDGLDDFKMFAYNDYTISDAQRSQETMSSIKVWLNKPYTDKNGTTYNNYGTYIMQQYYKHPEYFRNSYAFSHNVCPGFFFSVADGEGVYTEIPEMCIRFYYRLLNEKDSIVNYATALAGTEEVLQTTKITNEKDVLRQLAADNSCTYLKAPAGLYTEVTLPVDEVFSAHEADSLLMAGMSFQRINYGYYDKTFKIPTHVLMVQKDSLNAFFEKEKMPNEKTFFYAEYTKKTNDYTFSNISNLLTTLSAQKRTGLAKDAEWTKKHPNWNKVLLVPVKATYSSNSSNPVITAFEQCIDFTCTKLAGGSESTNSPIRLTVIYGKFKQ